MTTEERDAVLPALQAPCGQGRARRGGAQLTPSQQQRLHQQLAGIDLEQLQRLFRQTDPAATPDQAVRPAPVLRLARTFEDRERDLRARAWGEMALKAGQVAVILVAGGQGTRLGFEGPKGTYPIGPLSGKSLFQIHAEKVLALGRRYDAPLPLYVMTSAENDADTRSFFDEHEWFGLDPDQVVFFTQGTMPALDRETGRLLFAAKDRLATSPDGHGGVLHALSAGGHLADLARRGIQYLFYYQVDNPLVMVADPTYLGHHIEAVAEMSLKVVPKLSPQEKLGVAAEVDGRVRIIEYRELSPEAAARRGSDGGLELWAGSIAVHIFNLSFLERLAAEGTALPYHRAVKKVPHLDEHGRLVHPDRPNAVKFESFVFDALPQARKALVVATRRAKEFEPLKNAEGENSPETVCRAMSNLFAAWLNSAGIEVARRADGSAAVPIEISPLFALDAEEFRRRQHGADRVTEPLLLDALAEVGGMLSKLKLTRARDRMNIMNIPGGRSAGSIPSSDSESPGDRTAFSSPHTEHTCQADIFC